MLYVSNSCTIFLELSRCCTKKQRATVSITCAAQGLLIPVVSSSQIKIRFAQQQTANRGRRNSKEWELGKEEGRGELTLMCGYSVPCEVRLSTTC